MIHDALLILWDCTQAIPNDITTACAATDPAERQMFISLCEVAKSHHKIQNYVQSNNFHARKAQTRQRQFSLYAQALSDGISEELQSYKKTLVEVEKLVIANNTHNLTFVFSHVEKYRGLFNALNRMISMIKERQLTGCQILSVTYQHILSGNEMVHGSIAKIFSNINKLFLNQLCSWLIYGDLKDPYNEFFIECSKKDASGSDNISCPSSINITDKSMMQECDYHLCPDKIPYYIPLSLAQEILFIGKTVLLFGFDPRKLKNNVSLGTNTKLPLQRFGANEFRRFTIWGDKEAKFHEKFQNLKEADEFEVCNLKSLVREIKECVTMHLWTVIVEEGRLIHELRLMKDFFLLGRGELFLELLRLGSHILDGPITRTSTRDMNQAFQLAARAVFLGNSADIEKFSFELTYVKNNLSVTTSTNDDSSTIADGWSSVVLKYHFKWPLHLLFTPEVLAHYNDLFRFLLRIKKTQHGLHALWMTYKNSNNFPMRQLHNKLMFLMDNLQHYLQADVLETNFSKFMEVVNKTNDFEKLKEAHATFLNDVLSQSFHTFTKDEQSDADCADSLVITNPVFMNIMELLKLCDSFCNMSETVSDKESEEYYLRGYTERYTKLAQRLLQLLVSSGATYGACLSRLLVRLDYNRWLSADVRLTSSMTAMLDHTLSSP